MPIFIQRSDIIQTELRMQLLPFDIEPSSRSTCRAHSSSTISVPSKEVLQFSSLDGPAGRLVVATAYIPCRPP